MTFPCPECGEPLEELDVGPTEMGSRPRRFQCTACCLCFELDAAGSLLEDEE